MDSKLFKFLILTEVAIPYYFKSFKEDKCYLFMKIDIIKMYIKRERHKNVKFTIISLSTLFTFISFSLYMST